MIVPRRLLLVGVALSIAGCMFDTIDTKSQRSEECQALRGQEQDRCYEALGKTQAEYDRERDQVIKGE